MDIGEITDEVRRSVQGEQVNLGAPRDVTEGTIILNRDFTAVDIFSRTVRYEDDASGETVNSSDLNNDMTKVKNRPYMKLDPTPPGSGVGDEDLAFPYAYRQGLYVGLSGSNNDGERVPLPGIEWEQKTVSQERRANRISIDTDSMSYATPWNITMFDDSPFVVLGEVPDRVTVDGETINPITEVKRAIIHAMQGTLGPGDLTSS